MQPPDAVRAVEFTRRRGGEHDGGAGMFAVLLGERVHRFFQQADRPHRVGCLGLGHLHLAIDASGGFRDGCFQ